LFGQGAAIDGDIGGGCTFRDAMDRIGDNLFTATGRAGNHDRAVAATGELHQHTQLLHFCTATDQFRCEERFNIYVTHATTQTTIKKPAMPALGGSKIPQSPNRHLVETVMNKDG